MVSLSSETANGTFAFDEWGGGICFCEDGVGVSFGKNVLYSTDIAICFSGVCNFR
jgi:hypothetical protein